MTIPTPDPEAETSAAPAPPRSTKRPDRPARKTLRGGAAALRPARAALGPARALSDVVRYWYAERATLRQGMISLSISAAGNIPTGLALAAMEDRLRILPGLFILIPAAIGMRGAIFGALGSRLGTSMHAGILRFSADRSGVLSQNVYATAVLTFAVCLFLAIAARVITAATGLPTISVWDYVVISVLGGVASSVLLVVVTVWLAWAGSRRGWDLDSVAAPIITFAGDLITVPALFLASFAAGRGAVTFAAGVACALVCLAAIWSGIRTRRPVARRIMGESAVTLALASIVNLIAGAVIQHRIDGFLAFPALLVMLPPFLENAGALGGIVSSRLASKLHLGSIRARALPDRLAALDITLAGPWSILNFALTGLAAHFVAGAVGDASPGAAFMTGIALLAGAMATLGAAFVAYTTAVATFRFDLDPDNHGIAAVTSTMDLVGVVCVVAAAALLGVT